MLFDINNSFLDSFSSHERGYELNLTLRQKTKEAVVATAYEKASFFSK